jgi:short-subunit dehydrogenase
MAKWQDQIVVIMGGSAGLGLALAKEFGKKGARPILMGRSADKLAAARTELAAENIEADVFSADAQREDELRQAVEQIIRRHGKIDAWVNCVGRSIRIELSRATSDDYRELMEVNLISAINGTRVALPHLERTAGHLVNIGSLSCRTAWPYLAPYTTSKFALAGFTQQLRIEGPRNVHYLLACPGPIQRHDAGRRYESEAKRLPGHASEPGAGARIEGVSAVRVARGIIRACERRKAELVLPLRVRLLFVIAAFSPRLADWILRRLIR